MFELAKMENPTEINKLLEQVLKIVDEVPFGNSDFQNKTTVVNGELSPHRAYRHSSLRIINRLNALNECYYWMKENELKIKKLEREIQRLKKNKPEDYDIDIEIKKIEIDKIRSNYPYTQKLIKDAIREIKSLSPIIEKVWKLDRETFESMEEEHFKKLHKLATEIPNEHIKSLLNIDSTLYDDLVNNNLLKWENILKLNN